MFIVFTFKYRTKTGDITLFGNAFITKIEHRLGYTSESKFSPQFLRTAYILKTILRNVVYISLNVLSENHYSI